MSPDTLPLFPESRQVALSDRPIVEGYFSRFPNEISERTFGSIFAWRIFERRSEISQLNGHLVISWFKPKIGRTVLVPVGGAPVSVLKQLAGRDLLPQHDFVGCYGLLEGDVRELGPTSVKSESLREDWDYVYRTKDLINLEGPNYHTQRKELKKATLEHELIFERMTRAHQRACLELEDKWCDIKHCTLDKYTHAEDLALREALANMEELGLFGGIVLEGERIQAITLAERLNDNTAVVHFEKANPVIRGLYQFINQQFCEHSLSGFEFVNREQDVGEPGLRRAKEGYHPHHFVEKHVAMFR